LPSYDQATSGGDVTAGEGKSMMGSFTAPTPSPSSKEDDSAAKAADAQAKADAKEAAAAEKAAAKQAAAEKKQVSVLITHTA